jgi:hypothetical protein
VATDERDARLAENEAIFRDANEAIERRAAELDFSAVVPFLCECGDRACRELIRLEREDYARVRTRPTWFLILPEHEEIATTSGRVLERLDGYLIVEKTGVAGAVAEALDSAAPQEP